MMGDNMWVVTVIGPATVGGAEDSRVRVYGPFASEAEASAWEDAHLDAPPRSRAEFVEVTPPDALDQSA